MFVDEMLAVMPNELFAEWCAYDTIEPIGQEATHRLLAIGASAASWGKVSPAEIAPWLPKETEEREATAEEVIAMAQAAMRGGR